MKRSADIQEEVMQKGIHPDTIPSKVQKEFPF